MVDLQLLLHGASRELVVLVDDRGAVVEADERARRLLGIVPGTALTAILHPRGKAAELLRRARHEPLDRVEFAIEQQGRLRLLECAARPAGDAVALLCSLVPDDYGSALHAMGAALSDIVDLNREVARQKRDLERLNAELVEADLGIRVLLAEVEERAQASADLALRRSRAIATASHELRTPIQAIRWSAEEMLYGGLDVDASAVHEQLEGIVRMSTELAHLVEDLLDVTRDASDGPQVRPRRFRVSELLGALRGIMRPVLAEGMEVRLRLDDPPEDVELETDFGKLVQILRNLLTNGLRHTERGEVRLVVGTDPDRIRFDVRDTGPGIAAEDRERIFEELVRLRDDRPGMGLGLPIARRLARLLGGELTLESEVGRGSAFTLRVPRVLQSGA